MKFYGSRYNDVIVGTSGADTFHGWRGDDTIRGGFGNDTIDGGWGQDVLYGGRGEDVFVFSHADHSTAQKPDMIADFQRGIDKINLSALSLDKDDVSIYARRITIDTDDDGVDDMVIQMNVKATFDDIIF